RRARLGRLRLRGPQLREPGHGRSYRLDPCSRAGRGDHRRMPGPRGRGRRGSRRRLPDHGRPRQRGEDARGRRRKSPYRTYDEPRPLDRFRKRTQAERPGRALRSGPHSPGAPRFCPALTNDREKRHQPLVTPISWCPLSLPQPDFGVLRKAQRGDERAFSIIVRAYQVPVFNYVLRLVGDRSLAEDLTQEIFLRVFQGLPRFSLRSKFTTWLFQVAKNRVLDEL